MLLNKKANANAIILFTILLIVTVIIITVFSPTDYRRALLNESYSNANDYGNVVLFEAADVVINETDLEEGTESIYLHDAELDYAAHRKEEQISGSFEISNSFIEDNSAKFYLNVDDSFQGMYFTFYVISKEGNGKINILLNGQSIYTASPDEGEKVNVYVPKNALKKGDNEIVIRATYPLNIFKENSFSIVDLRAFLTERNEEQRVEHTFIVEDASEIREPALYAYVTKMPYSIANSKIKITINEVEVFEGVPATINDYETPQVFYLPLEEIYLKDGVNEIIWEVDLGGAYSVDFVKIEYETLEEPDEEEESVFRFNIDSDAYKKVRSKRYSCVLTFESDDINKMFEYNINGNKSSAAVSSSEISFDVCDSLRKGLNSLKVSSGEDLLFSRIKLEIKR